MRRRDFIAAAASGLLVPLPVAQAQSGLPLLAGLIVDNPDQFWTALREALRDNGLVEGKTIRLDLRSGGGSLEGLARQARELADAQPNVIVAVQTAAVQAVMKATKAIPIVMVAAAPVETGIVRSLSRPEGNVTGVTTMVGELAGKALGIAREVMPSLGHAAILVTAHDAAFGERMRQDVEAAGRLLGLKVDSALVGTTQEIEAAFARMTAAGVQAFVAQPSLPRSRVLALSHQHRVPVIAVSPTWAKSGALLSYSAHIPDVCNKLARYADRLLKGSKAADLPIELPTRFELVVNRRSAEALGLEIPFGLLARADEVIE